MKDKGLIFNSAVFILYSGLVLAGMYYHELWGDELHSWNIVKGSNSLGELFRNIRYEGHPPLWYIYLYCFTRFSHALIFLKAAQFIFVASGSFLLLFFSPFSKLQKTIILCGYFFIFEYALLARNYMPAVFFAFCLAIIFHREFKYKTVLYCILLFLLSNVHLLGLLLAVAIHTGYCFGKMKSGVTGLAHLTAGLLVFLPAVYFILPPADSQLGFQFWISRWTFSKFYQVAGGLLRAFFPFPDPGNFHWWNSHYFLDRDNLPFRLVSSLLAVFLAVVIYATSRKSKTALVVLATNFVLTFLLALIFPMSAARYTGFMWIGFIVSAWISFLDSSKPFNGRLFLFLLLLQVPAGFFAYTRELTGEFSSSASVVEMQKQIPLGTFSATDYWCLNNLSAWLDTPYYCIELQKNISFLKWNSAMKAAIHYDYAKGLTDLLNRNGGKPFYFFSSRPYNVLLPHQSSGNHIRLTLAAASSEAVENSGQVYLFLVEAN